MNSVAEAMKKLHIAKNFTLPLEAVTQTFGILGKRGGGKSYTAKVMAEEMIKAGAHVCAVDPIGNWWGLRVASDGKSPGLPITVLGGEYGDVPIEASEKAGEFVARLTIEEKLSLVIDLSLFRKGEQTAFMIGWAETLYRLNREALHLFIDEADAWAPQRPVGNLAPRLLGAMEDLVRRGRARGLGITMITQRSASINKDLLTQIEVLVAKRTIAPQDREAIEAWVKVHGTPEQKATMMNSLPSLPREEAWFWSPGWLDIFQRVAIRELETFDSSATPEVGKRRIEPRTLADVDLEKLRARMAETIEKAKAEDPRELRKQIADLNKQLAAKTPVRPPAKEIPAERLQAHFEKGVQAERKRIASEVGGFLADARQGLRKILPVKIAFEHAGSSFDYFSGDQPLVSLDHAIENLKKSAPLPDVVLLEPRVAKPAISASPHVARAVPAAARAPAEGEFTLDRLRKTLLTVLAQHPEGLTKGQVILHSGYRASGDVSMAFAELARHGYMVSENGKLLITQPGFERLGEYDPLPTGAELLGFLLSGDKLSKVEKALLRVIADAQPHAIAKGETVEKAGYKPSGDVSTAFARLVRYGYVVNESGRLKLAKELV